MIPIAFIAGLKWADRYDVSPRDRSRLVVLMHVLERTAGAAPALLVGKQQAERLAPPPPPPIRDDAGRSSPAERERETKGRGSKAARTQGE